MPVVLFELKSYLARLEQLEKEQPTGRQVPEHRELADLCGMTDVTFSRMVNNNRDAIRRDTLAIIVAELRRRGFPVQMDDLFSFHD